MASILVVCTGNVCRSPIAEGFLRDALERRLGGEAPIVASAGTAGWAGSPAIAESVQAASERGIDISGHIATRLLPAHVEGADLVVAMAAEHRDLVCHAMADAIAKTFTLKEIVRLLEHMPRSNDFDRPPAELLSLRIAAAAALRRSGFEGNARDEDIADPLGLSIDTFRAVAWELEDWCARLVDALFGSAPAHAARGEEARP